MLTRRRNISGILVVAAFLIISGVGLQAGAIQTTLTFTGTCFDCNNALGILVLQNFNGTDFSNDNFVSFSYSSDLISFTLTGIGSGADQADSASGSFPGGLPGVSNGVFITSQGMTTIFQDNGNGGSWCAGFNGCNLDFGVNGAFGVGVPEPATWGLLAVGLGCLGLFRRRTTA